ncbi:MAG: tellurite methyltransferase [Myxococcota bacterium]|jgi:tellurite methyltransferase
MLAGYPLMMSTSDLQRWEERYKDLLTPPTPSTFLEEIRHLLPPPGRALDVAGGLSPDAERLMEWGWQLTVTDISPTALQHVAARCPGLQTAQRDLEQQPLPEGPWDLIVCQNYLQRPLIGAIASALGSGGVLALRVATVENLIAHARPGRRFLLESGEAVALVRAAGLTVRWSQEGWSEVGSGQLRHEARVVGVRG